MADGSKEAMGGNSRPSGEVDVTKVTRDAMRQMQMSDDDLRAVAEPYQIVVRAQLDASGVSVRVIGNAHFGEEYPIGGDGDDGPTARSHAGYTVEVGPEDQQMVAQMLAGLAAKYRAQAIGGAMKAAYTTYDPLAVIEIK